MNRPAYRGGMCFPLLGTSRPCTGPGPDSSGALPQRGAVPAARVPFRHEPGTKGCPVIPGGRAAPATAPRRVVGTSAYTQYAEMHRIRHRALIHRGLRDSP
ncbi:hypothetical protein GCM10009564_32440 [Streptomyces thermogriseus]|uniref:Uncharacterized protein n=1 Tax=Streptomyces thermogriseus TaxID=75292 RepID=A0ABN1T0M1_9ACTN